MKYALKFSPYFESFFSHLQKQNMFENKSNSDLHTQVNSYLLFSYYTGL